MTTDALFPYPGTGPPPLTQDQRRTERQAVCITAGGHPLGLVLGPHAVHRHPATRDQLYTRNDPARRPFTCGTCIHRQVVTWRAGAYPKCWVPIDGRDDTRATHGASTDVRAWWPACTLHEEIPR